jgi:hypothetical protein
MQPSLQNKMKFSLPTSHVSLSPPFQISFFAPGNKVRILRTEHFVIRNVETARHWFGL